MVGFRRTHDQLSFCRHSPSRQFTVVARVSSVYQRRHYAGNLLLNDFRVVWHYLAPAFSRFFSILFDVVVLLLTPNLKCVRVPAAVGRYWRSEDGDEVLDCRRRRLTGVDLSSLTIRQSVYIINLLRSSSCQVFLQVDGHTLIYAEGDMLLTKTAF